MISKKMEKLVAGSSVIRAMFEEGKQILFEGEQFFVPKEYDTYLKIHYGDYMKLPPIEKREPIHADIIDLNRRFEAINV